MGTPTDGSPAPRIPLTHRIAQVFVVIVVIVAAAYFGVPLTTGSAPSQAPVGPGAGSESGPDSGSDGGLGSGSSSEAGAGRGDRGLGERGGVAGVDLVESQARVVRLMRERRSGVMVAFDARVLRTISDDNEGSRHQRFILEVADETAPRGTILVAHNIDLAERVPLRAGDIVSLYGQYEFNPEGGVMHWTHHDPDGSHEGGWIEHEGVRYE